jgi:hypothetical protein
MIMKQRTPYSIALMLSLVFICSVSSQNKDVSIQGSVMNAYNTSIPYASISIPTKYIGSSANEEGDFKLSIPAKYLSESLIISSIGYKSFTIKVQDYMNLIEKVIVLEEDRAELSEIKVLSSITYVKRAFKNIKNTTISSRHQLKILYRRFSVEDNKARFFVEHYLKMLDKGPNAATFNKLEVIQGRKSADYRFINVKQNAHAAVFMAQKNVLRQGINLKEYKWSRKGDTAYDGEDILIIEGSRWKGDYLRLYIGLDNYGIFKVESSILNSIYIYKKNIDGKLYLSYHNREWKTKKNLSEYQMKALGKKSLKIDLSYRHEVFVLGLETNREKIKVKNNRLDLDIGDMDVPYSDSFWNNFTAPPATKFYKKSVGELEAIFGVPIDVQFKSVNN